MKLIVSRKEIRSFQSLENDIPDNIEDIHQVEELSIEHHQQELIPEVYKEK